MAKRTANNGWGKRWERRLKKCKRQGDRGTVARDTLPSIRHWWKSPQERQEAKRGVA